MFDWLEQEIALIKTPRFHLVDGPADDRLRDAMAQSDLSMPASYREFVLKFGNAKLYRRARNNSYRVGVFAGPRQAASEKDTTMFQIGFNDGANVYIKYVAGGQAPTILELEAGKWQDCEADFEAWLLNACSKARSCYSKSEWEKIARGPVPFTREELKILEARRKFSWTILGIDEYGNQIIKVMNSGDRSLPSYTLGVRSKNGKLNGAVSLPIQAVGPGESIVLHVDCYKDLVDPQEIEAFSLPDPLPEDRDRYRELSQALRRN